MTHAKRAFPSMRAADRALPSAAQPHATATGVGTQGTLLMTGNNGHLQSGLARGTHLVPTFDDALSRHRMLDAIEHARG